MVSRQPRGLENMKDHGLKSWDSREFKDVEYSAVWVCFFFYILLTQIKIAVAGKESEKPFLTGHRGLGSGCRSSLSPFPGGRHHWVHQKPGLSHRSPPFWKLKGSRPRAYKGRWKGGRA